MPTGYKILETKDSLRYLEIAKNIKNSHTIYDIHAHPFELLYMQDDYRADFDFEGVYSTTGSRFPIPRVKDIVMMQNGKDGKIFKLFSQSDIFRKNLSIVYGHTGPTVFGMQMELSHIDKVLLLPVAPAEGSVDKQMRDMEKMFGRDKRFGFGWSVPNSISNETICSHAKRVSDRFDIKAIKLHPNITEIDLNSKWGKDRVNSILETCSELNLPLIVHAGRSHLAGKPEASTYGDLNNLKRIDWSLSRSTVVFAHAGAYNCEYGEIDNDILPELRKLLSNYNNLMVDVSGLDYKTLLLILKNIDCERVIFGSDALYEPQWLAVVKLLKTMEETMKHFEEAFIRVACINPAQFVFR